MIKKISIGLIILSSVFLASCNDEARDTVSSEIKKEMTSQYVKIVKRDINPVQYSRGARLFQKNCASCHGKEAEGAKNWRQPDEQGKNLPPPLNGTGHTWHHSSKSLMNTIKKGTVKIGGNMPAWKDKLSKREIKLILTWITAQWPDEIYTAWYNRFQQKK